MAAPRGSQSQPNTPATRRRWPTECEALVKPASAACERLLRPQKGRIQPGFGTRWATQEAAKRGFHPAVAARSAKMWIVPRVARRAAGRVTWLARPRARMSRFFAPDTANRITLLDSSAG